MFRHDQSYFDSQSSGFILDPKKPRTAGKKIKRSGYKQLREPYRDVIDIAGIGGKESLSNALKISKCE